jgi:hypothetical protein
MLGAILTTYPLKNSIGLRPYEPTELNKSLILTRRNSKENTLSKNDGARSQPRD